MAEILTDDIDFAAYMQDTDCHHHVRSTGDYLEEVKRYFHSPDEIKGARMPWSKTHNDIRFRHGEVTLWNGYNGSGKSLVLGQVCMGFLDQGQKVCIASMEMKPHMTLARMCRQRATINPPTPEQISAFHHDTDRKLWLYDQQGTVKPNKMMAVIRYCADKIKIEHMVIDSLMKCGMGEDDYNGQKAFVDQLTACARDMQIHIHLVTHARKSASEHDLPGKMDVKGSGAITDQVDNVITVWRNKKKERAMQEGGDYRSQDPDCLLICDKQRNGDWEGKIGLYFDNRATRYVEWGIQA